MRRGFKAWCERTSIEYRRTLGVALTAALDPRQLAANMRVRVTTPSGIPTLSPPSRRQLTETDPDSWSAVTISWNDVRLVVLNSSHSEKRQRNSLAHELAHMILNHSPDGAHLSDAGLLFRGVHDREQEQEAEWLAGCLLVPRDGLLAACRTNESVRHLTDRFQVSVDMINWRLRVTGVLRQVRRLEAFGPIPKASVQPRVVRHS